MTTAASSMWAHCRRRCFPACRLGFLVGPKTLVAEARALRRLMVRHAPNNNQRTAALFLSLGHHDTLIRRLHRAYRTRWEIMGAALEKYMPASTRIPTFGGTSFWVQRTRRPRYRGAGARRGGEGTADRAGADQFRNAVAAAQLSSASPSPRSRTSASSRA